MQKMIATVNLRSIRRNAVAWKEKTNTKLCAVVKADAYGHGAEEVCLALEGVADMFAVATLSEAESISVSACGKDILLLTPPKDRWEAEEIVLNGIVASVPDVARARLLYEAGRRKNRPVRLHLQVNTGMNRYGAEIGEVAKICRYLKTRGLRAEGVYSHLYSTDEKICLSQREKFSHAVSIAKEFFPSITAHLSATFGATLGKEFSFDMVRIGLGLYGYLPKADQKNAPKLKKALSVCAYVLEARKYEGGGLGYGKPDRKEKRQAKKTGIAVLRAGYADGLGRKKKQSFLSPIAGNLCMDAGVLLKKARRGQKIPLLEDVDEVAKRSGTISYEVLCLATKRAEMRYEYK